MTQKTSKMKAIALLSGGLDSAIAAKLVMDQGIEVVGLNFHSPFCVCNSHAHSFECGAIYFAEKLGIPFKLIEKKDDYLEIVKHPKYGYGKHINPCIDCRIHILKSAKQYADEIGARFLITGEVLGQRPKSQTMHALQIVDKESGLEGWILRPLSAKLLPETIPEKEGWVHREFFLSIQGRRRNIQVELGKEYRLIRQYCAGGGCLLTDEHFAKKMKDYLDYNPIPKMSDIKFLKIGRHFRYNNKKIIVGRNQAENEFLSKFARKSDIILEIKDNVGPIVLIEDSASEAEIKFACYLTVKYSDAEKNNKEENEVIVKDNSKNVKNMVLRLSEIPKIDQYQIL